MWAFGCGGGGSRCEGGAANDWAESKSESPEVARQALRKRGWRCFMDGSLILRISQKATFAKKAGDELKRNIPGD